MGKLFGTDGIRGVANHDLTPELAFRIGRIAAHLLSREHEDPLFLIGRDTRISGPMLEGSLLAGITSAGAGARLLGIVSTPAVAYLTRQTQSAAGVVISASHNPVQDNGLKIFNSRGMKLSDALEEEIEALYFSKEDEQLPRPDGAGVGRAFWDGEALQVYIDHLKKLAPSLHGMHLVIDCGHGAACSCAPELLSSLGARVAAIHDNPDGSLINVKCGATDTAELQREVLKRGADLGLAFDGDADRLIAVDEKGDPVDGDAIMALCAEDMLHKEKLNNLTLVATVMSNGGLDILAEEAGFRVLRTAVGDRYVLEKMIEGNYNLGGEQSGHIIFSDHATTGDGLLTALQLLQVVLDRGKPLSELAARLTRLPQVLVNQPVVSKEGWDRKPSISAAIDDTKEKLGRFGRILVRASGTENLIRVMIEAPLSEDRLFDYARSLAAIIEKEQEQ